MTGKKNSIRKIPARIQEATQDNQLLFVIIGLGIALLTIGVIPTHTEMLIAVGAAFIIAGGVGVYMMLATKQVAKNLHNRFNEQNSILENHTKIMSKMDDSLREIASSQKEIASSQSKNHSEMIEVLKKIESGFSNMGKGLKKIENKL